MPVDQTDFRRVMSHFPTGITVVTTGSGDEIHGLTVNAFCSVSLEPPLILVCLNNQGYCHALIRRSGVFAVNMPARQAMVPQLVPQHKLMNAISLQMGGMTLTRIVGPAVADVHRNV